MQNDEYINAVKTANVQAQYNDWAKRQNAQNNNIPIEPITYSAYSQSAPYRDSLAANMGALGRHAEDNLGQFTRFAQQKKDGVDPSGIDKVNADRQVELLYRQMLAEQDKRSMMEAAGYAMKNAKTRALSTMRGNIQEALAPVTPYGTFPPLEADWDETDDIGRYLASLPYLIPALQR